MPRIAANLLMTSLGTIRTGEEIPAKLPKEELEVIRNAGGIKGEDPRETVEAKAEAKSAAKTKDAKAAQIRAAERAVQDAELAVSNASSDADKKAAEDLLVEAKQELEDLKNG